VHVGSISVSTACSASRRARSAGVYAGFVRPARLRRQRLDRGGFVPLLVPRLLPELLPSGITLAWSHSRSCWRRLGTLVAIAPACRRSRRVARAPVRVLLRAEPLPPRLAVALASSGAGRVGVRRGLGAGRRARLAAWFTLGIAVLLGLPRSAWMPRLARAGPRRAGPRAGSASAVRRGIRRVVALGLGTA
jgi:hypothetical protein